MTKPIATRFISAQKIHGVEDLAEAIYHLADALRECEDAHLVPGSDPALRLIAAAVGDLANVTTKVRSQLHNDCVVEACEAGPLSALVRTLQHASDIDPRLQERFHVRAEEALKALADHLGLQPADYNIGPITDDESECAPVMLAAPEFLVFINAIPSGDQEHHVRYEKRIDQSSISKVVHFAPIEVMDAPGVFASRLAAQVELEGWRIRDSELNAVRATAGAEMLSTYAFRRGHERTGNVLRAHHLIADICHCLSLHEGLSGEAAFAVLLRASDLFDSETAAAID